MTRPTPIAVEKGDPLSREESNLDPSRRVPTSASQHISREMSGEHTVDGNGISLLGEVLSVSGGDLVNSNTHFYSG